VRRRGIAAVVIVALASPVLAEGVLPIGGAFGNEAGCAFYMSGDRSLPDLAVITPYTFAAEGGGCHFEELVVDSDDRFELEASCSGGTLAGDRVVAVIGSHIEGYAVRIGDQHWEDLGLCPGTEVLFAPPGVQV
jgi:hypothetical protein